MTDEKEDKRDFFSRMNTVQTVFFYIGIAVISFIVGYVGALILINIRKSIQVNTIKKIAAFKACGEELKRLDFKFHENPEKCSCYSTKNANSIYGCTDNENLMFKI